MDQQVPLHNPLGHLEEARLLPDCVEGTRRLLCSRYSLVAQALQYTVRPVAGPGPKRHPENRFPATEHRLV